MYDNVSVVAGEMASNLTSSHLDKVKKAEDTLEGLEAITVNDLANVVCGSSSS